MSYLVTGWDNWPQVLKPVTLNTGWNTIGFTGNKLYAELDYVEVT